MHSLSEYLCAISNRGDSYGAHGGILDLLSWCGKPNTQAVTLDDARRFYENPNQPYEIPVDDDINQSIKK
ncbi:MAG: hypothetical protein RR502_03770 [Oscillospiraceae bacterium]